MFDVYSMQRLIAILWCVVLLWATEATAQQVPERVLPPTLSVAARAQVAVADTVLQQRTRAVPGGRIDARSGVQRAAYRLRPSTTGAATPEAAARAFFREVAPRFGWQPDARDLVLLRTQQHPRSTHLTYQQTMDGVPVYGRYVTVSLNADGQPTMALSGYAPRLKTAAGFTTQPTLSAAEAQTRATAAVTTVGATTTEPDLVVFPSAPPRLAWRLLAWPDDGPGEWEVLIDARSGDVVYLVNQATHAHGKTKRAQGNKTEGIVSNPQPKTRNPKPATQNPQPIIQTDGTGLVFDPDPLTTAGVDYGAPYVDANDTDVPELNAERITVTLRDITQGNDGLYRLDGPYASVDASVGQNTAYTPPAEATPDGFQYLRSDQHFESVMVYYHIDTSQRYLQSLDLGRGVQDGPIRVNPHGLGSADNSQYQPGLNLLQFGDGGIDDAEDADVIWHEYAHALLEAGAPGLLSCANCEARALHEGWADYWAASYSRYLEEAGIVPPGDWRKVFSWDGNEFWNGRRLDSEAQYPGDLTGNIYTDGLLWATTLMEVYDDLGRTVTDRLNLLSHAYLSPGATLADAANAIIQADADYYGGAHLSVLLERFGDRGLVDPSTYGPALAHTPLGYQPEAGATVTFDVNAAPSSAAIATVTVTYSIDGGAAETVALADQGNNQYSTSVTFPSTAERVTYYLEAADADNRRSTLPSNAPDVTYAFYVGPDREAPQVTHTPLTSASLQAWPPEVAATVEDNLEVGTVIVTYILEDAGGQTVEEGTFELDGQESTYAAPFPVTADKVAAGSTVRYRITARDGGDPPNETTLPAEGDFFAFPVVTEGALASYDFEVPQGTATGAWTHGTPTYFLQAARSGSGVWSTGLATAYPGTVSQATLTLPSVNLNGLNEAYLVFWHWYDIENNGASGEDLILWDGANVKLSANGGDWYVEVPFGGYTGDIDSNFDNPMGGQPAWGGYSYGWQRVVVPLPTEADVRVRFAFGTDTSNLDQTLAFAGWHIDDATITTERPVDATPPVVTHAPAAETLRAPGNAQPQVLVRATDDTGIASVFAEYRFVPDGGAPTSGTARIPMQLTTQDAFAGRLPVPEGVSGDRIEYRLMLRDADGTATTYPAEGDPPLQIAYEDVDRMAVLPGASAAGAWQPAGDGRWRAEPGGSGVSTLTLSPVDLPTDAKTIQFTLDHIYLLGTDLGGNVKVSVDGGAWRSLTPITGYTLAFALGTTHPMAGEAVFTSARSAVPVQSVFDLSEYAGREVQLRLDLGATRGARDDEAWIVDDAMLAFLDIDTAVDTETPLPTELTLHPNYPNPFADRTTIRYALPAPMDVHLDVYNLLGQRVATLVDAPQPAGTHTATLRADGLASGVYLLRLRAGDVHRTARIIVAR